MLMSLPFFLQIDDKRLSAMYHGPEENSHVSNYRMVLTNFPLTLEQKKWSKAERENLGKGIKQQFHQLVVQISVDRIRYYIFDSVFSVPFFYYHASKHMAVRITRLALGLILTLIFSSCDMFILVIGLS